MDVSRETPHVTTKPKCYDLTSILVLRKSGAARSRAPPALAKSKGSKPGASKRGVGVNKYQPLPTCDEQAYAESE